MKKVLNLILLLVILLPAPLLALGANLTVKERGGVSRSAWPVTSGVPIPEGKLFGEGGVSCGYGSQSRVLSTWPDGSTKWLLVDFQADVGANGTVSYALTGSGGVPPP